MSNIIPGGWELATIGSLGKVITGSTPSTQEPKFWGGDVPFISPSDFDGSVYVKETQRKLTKLGADKGRLLPKDSVLVTCIGSLGGIAMAASESTTNQQINSLVPSRDNDPRFCFYNILFNIDELTKNAGTTTIPIINKSTFELINLLRPPLPEQQKIASILTAVDEVIESTTAQINKLKDLKTGMMQELLTKGIGHTEFKDSPVGRIPKAWEVVKLRSVLEKIDSGWSPNCIEIPPNIGEWGVLKVSSVTRGTFLEEQSKTLPMDLDPRESIRVGKGDLLLTRANGVAELVGRCVMVKDEPKRKLMMSDKLLRLKPNGRITRKFLLHVFNSSETRKQIELCWGGSSGQKNIGQSDIKVFDIVLPRMEEQISIGNSLTNIDESIDAKAAKLKHITAIKSALMQDLLTGKRRVQL